MSYSFECRIVKVSNMNLLNLDPGKLPLSWYTWHRDVHLPGSKCVKIYLFFFLRKKHHYVNLEWIASLVGWSELYGHILYFSLDAWSHGINSHIELRILSDIYCKCDYDHLKFNLTEHHVIVMA